MPKLKIHKTYTAWYTSLLLGLLFFSSQVFAQNKTITGKIYSSESDSALAGVTVRIKGAAGSAISGADGAFTISAPGNATLIFSAIGFTTQEVAVANQSTLNVRLVIDPRSLQQVVVIGYGSVKRKDVTGAISSIGAEQIEKVPVTTLEQSLQGRAAGVQITSNDASPGGNINVLIRGTGSLANNGNVPLYVIDGYPLESGGINNINPNDIASIDVLKDASATAIYGMRAANGVVIITTKRGRKGGLQISLDAYEAFQSKPKEYKVLNAEQFATLANQVAANSNGNFQSFSAWSNPSALHSVDWQNALYRTGLTQNYSLAIRGGNDKVQSSTSLGYYGQKGIVQGSYFKRLTLATNLDYQPIKWLKSSTSFKYSHQDANVPFGGNGSNNLLALSELPPTLDSGNKLTYQIKDASGNYGFFNPIYTYVAKYSNPLFSIENNRYQNLTNFFLMNSSLEVTIINGLRIKTNAGITYNGYSGYYFAPEDDRLVNQYGAQAGATQNAAYSQSTNSSFDWLWENTLSYDRTFGRHTVNFVAGVTAQKNQYNSMAGSGIPPNNTIMDLAQSTAVTFTAGQNGQTITSLASTFGRLSYNYDERYFITGTLRRDGSSKFDEGHQYGLFPSGAVKWHAKQESFLQDVNWLSDLSFRGSYGAVGNSATIAPFQFLALYAAGSAANTAPNYGYTFGIPKQYAPGIYSTQPANPDLKWETDYQTDIGMDIAFLQGNLRLTADWYERKSQDFLLTIPAPAQSGYSYLTRNVGSMLNRGLEFALSYNHAVNRDFTWGLNATFSTLYNELTSITSGTTQLPNFGNPTTTIPGDGWNPFSETFVGQPVGEFFGYKSIGIFQSQAQIDKLNAAAVANGFAAYQKTITQPGDRYFADVNGDGTVNASDQVSLGSPIPKFFGGLNLDATFQSWDFNVYFYGVYGNKIFNFAESSLESFQNRSFVGVENISQEYLQNAWTPTNASNKYARITSNDDAIGSNVASSAYVENGSFLKLKNLTVGYSLPARVIGNLPFSKIRLYVSTQNLFTITGYKGLDPEIGYQGGNATQNGVDNGTYPSSRYFTVGLNVTFK
ncbi:MAG: TonB-dependent receptor [Bacteroidetes bacterium]|nr:TonB-dependent receptor [Bacteroidota bacterium]